MPIYRVYFTGLPKNEKALHIIDMQGFLLFLALYFRASGVEEGARTLDLRNHNPTL